MSIGLENPSALTRSSAQQKHRFRLIALGLMIILVAITGIGTILTVKDFDANVRNLQLPFRRPSDDTWSTGHTDTFSWKEQLELYALMQEEKKELREFFLKLCQMVLLNLMLPILTAILALKIRDGTDG